ncbi:helix-turn-helix domain-containing protein [Candidatus Bipolaricaulota bacterium]|nr:helix-turn-helix domain-containing protein [Candidatus Bipolaricaulota bacterium]
MSKVEAYLKVSDVAQYTGLKAEAVRDLIDEGELDALELNGQTKIKKSEIDRWLDEQINREALMDLAEKVEEDVGTEEVANALGMEEEELEEQMDE